MKLDGGAIYKSVGALNDARLPDPDGDPATLMKNIYQLQKRPLPTAENLGAEESSERSAAETAPAEEHPLEVPYSEQAWTSMFEQSASEPQAEFTKSFDPAFTPSDVELQTGECSIPTNQAEHAFDEYFASPEFSGAQAESGAEAEPFSRAAYESVSHESASEPQAEFARSFDPAFAPSSLEVQANECVIPAGQAEQAFDEYFSTGFEPSGKIAQDEVAPAQAEGPQGAIAEPYSEKAWAQGAFTSSLEPQAEGAAAFDELFGDKPSASSEPVSYEGVRIEEPYQRMETADESADSAQDASATEPYSEMAWAQGAVTSSLEPQAEGTTAFDAMFREQSGSGAFEASLESEQEPREWEPEPEPEAEDIPTVSRFVSQGNEEEISLDALLDEIIKAGE